jgi:arylformamidase
MTAIWRGMDRAALDAGYNNRAAVPDTGRYFTDWAERSAETRATRPHRSNVRFGPNLAETIDVFDAANHNAPFLLFVHGGYWRSLDKSEFSFVAEGPMSHGFAVGVMNYTLCPATNVEGIVGEVRRAVAWLAEKEAPGRALYIAGHSAGGHLTVSAMDHPAVRGALAISGVYDLEPIRLSYLNDDVRLSAEEVERVSPIRHLPERSAPLLLTVGAEELPELRRQSADYWAAWATRGLTGAMVSMKGENHFSILDDFARPEGLQTRMLAELAGLI